MSGIALKLASATLAAKAEMTPAAVCCHKINGKKTLFARMRDIRGQGRTHLSWHNSSYVPTWIGGERLKGLGPWRISANRLLTYEAEFTTDKDRALSEPWFSGDSHDLLSGRSLKLPALIFSDHPFAFLFRQSTLNILLVLAVWLLVSTSTRRILERIHYLEKFMRVCAWCRRIHFKSQWMRLEEFMQQGFDTPTTHGICAECLEKQQAAIEKARQQRKNKAQNLAEG